MAVRTSFTAGEVLAAADLTDTFGSKIDYALATNAQSGTGASAYTFVLADASRLTTASGATEKTFTIPPQASVAWANNSIIRVVNYGAGGLTIAGGAGVTVTNTAKTVAQYESAAAIRTGSNAWTLVPFSGGSANADFSDAATGTYSDGGVDYKYKTYTGSGSVTITKAGLCDVLVVGGGGAGFIGGGGAGGRVYVTSTYLPAAALTVTVGGGGAAQGGPGTTSSLNNIYAFGGGGQFSDGGSSGFGYQGGSGGGGFRLAGGPGVLGQGNSGGSGVTDAMGGGGGANAAGVNGTGSDGGNGGAGIADSITGSSVTRAGGGGGSGAITQGTGGAGGGGAAGSAGGTAGTANTGGGGGGRFNSGNGGNGGSGVVIIRVRTN